jgi:predicted nucleotidyltransferase
MKQFDLKSNNIVWDIKKKILEVNPSAEIYLYGSRARGDAQKESDWDILILLNEDNFSRKDEKLFRDNLFELELNNEEIISIIAFSKNDWHKKHSITPFYESVMREGIKL